MTTTTTARPGRNEPCHCGSGRKYKQCHLQQDEAEALAAARAAAAEKADAEKADAEKADAKKADAAKADADKTEAPPQGAGQPIPPAPARKTPMRQPWKTNTHGFQRMSTPRKVGG
jgi:SEC-C motif